MFDRITLENGLRVVGEKLTHLHSCTVGVWVKVGSMNELPQENGLSHFIEHMVFKGTQTRSARDIAEEMDAVGGQLNAFTSKDSTCFYAKVIDTDVELAVDILSDLTMRPKFDPDELNKERGVVLEEIAMVEDTPEDLVADLLAQTQYTGSLGMTILGPAKAIRGYSREDMLRYWQKHYTMDNIVLAVAGNYDWEQFLALARRFFQCPNPNVERPALPISSFVGAHAAREKDTEQLHLCMGFPGVALGADDLYPLSVFNNAFGGGLSSRLFQRIREELGMVYSIYSFPTSYPGSGSFTIYAGTNPENGETVIREIREQIALLLDKGLTEKEFGSAKAQLRSGYVLGLESSSGRMQSLGRGELLLHELRTPEQQLKRIEDITPEDVKRVSHAVLTAKPSFAVVGKKAEKYVGALKDK